MTMKRVRANSAVAARRKSGGPRITVTKVNKIKGSKNMFSITTRKKKM